MRRRRLEFSVREPPQARMELPGVVEASLRELISPAAFANECIDAGDLQVRISWVRGTITVQAAAELDADPEIMLVDPIANLVDAHAWRALEGSRS